MYMSVNEGIKSLFGGSYKDVTKIKLVLHLLANPTKNRHANTTIIGDTVYHGEIVKNLKLFDSVYTLEKYKSTARAVRQAVVTFGSGRVSGPLLLRNLKRLQQL